MIEPKQCMSQQAYYLPIQTFFLFQVYMGHADMGVWGFVCSKTVNMYVDCSPPYIHSHIHWISRAPRPLLPASNLFRIFDIYSWCLIFLSIFIVTTFLVVAAKLGTHYGAGTHDMVEAALVPYK